MRRHKSNLRWAQKIKSQKKTFSHNKESGKFERVRFLVEVLFVSIAAIWAVVHFYYNEYKKPQSNPKPIIFNVEIINAGIKDGTRALKLNTVITNIGKKTLYITPVEYTLRGLRVYKTPTTLKGANKTPTEKLNQLAIYTSIQNSGYILKPSETVSRGVLTEIGTFLYPLEKIHSSYIFHMPAGAYDSVSVTLKAGTYEKTIADDMNVVLDGDSTYTRNRVTGELTKLPTNETIDIHKKITKEEFGYNGFFSLWTMQGYDSEKTIPDCQYYLKKNKQTVDAFLLERNIKKSNLTKIYKLHPELPMLIMNTESMDDNEREYWFNLAPSMTESHITRLFNILHTEKSKLEALEEKYHKEIQLLSNKGQKVTNNIENNTQKSAHEIYCE